MQERYLYEYAVIRFVPKVEREEFISSEVDTNCLKEGLKVFDKICQGNKNGGTIAQMDIPDRFRWLTAVKSSCIQVSRPHPGFSENLDATLERLFKELVL